MIVNYFDESFWVSYWKERNKMTNELEEMKRMIELQRQVFERNMNYLILKLQELKNIGTAIGEVSQYKCLEAVQRELNVEIDKMLMEFQK